VIKGVIFDLDGVLVSTDELHFRAWKRLAEEIGIADFTKEDNLRQKGVSRMESLEIVLEKGNRSYSEEEKLALAERKNRYYVDYLQELDHKAVLKDVMKTLILLRERGVKIGVGSASKNTPLILERTGLEPYIDKVSCGLDVTKSKPDPEVFLVAARKLELPNEECLVVEDSAAGIVAARAANMKSLGVGPEYRQLGADYESLTLQSEVDWNIILQ
jgi:beta-phosphoglucomutase